jgi:hypothetical protein
MSRTVENKRWDQEIEKFFENFPFQSDVLEDSPALWDFTPYFRAKLADLLTCVDQQAYEAGYRKAVHDHLHTEL